MKNIAFLPTARNIARKYTTVSVTNQVSIIQWNMDRRIRVKYLSFQAFTFLLTPFLFCRLHFYLLLIEAFSTVATNVINIAGFHYPFFFSSEFFLVIIGWCFFLFFDSIWLFYIPVWRFLSTDVNNAAGRRSLSLLLRFAIGWDF